MAPEYDRTICLRLYVPAKQLRPIGCCEPDIFQRQTTAGFPVLIHPRLGMVDEELVKDAHRALLRKTATSQAAEKSVYTYQHPWSLPEWC